MVLSLPTSEVFLMDLSKLSDDQLLVRTESEFAIERNASHNILLHLKEIKSRRLYAKRGYESMFVMLVEAFRLSEPAAGQRLKALDLMIAVPVAEERLISGDLTMSNL